MAYREGLTSLSQRFGQALLTLTAIQEHAGDEIKFVVETAARIVVAYTPEVQMHSYGIDEGGVIRRADSPISGLTSWRPEQERFSGSPLEQLHQLTAQADREQEAGINNQPVDATEVRSLFALILGGSLDVLDPED